MIPIQNLDDAQRNTIAEALRIIANVIAAPAAVSEPITDPQQPAAADPAAQQAAAAAAQQQAAQQAAAQQAAQQAAAQQAAQQAAAQQAAAVAAQQQAAQQAAAQQTTAPAGPVTMDTLLSRLKALNPQTGGQLKTHAEAIFQKYGSTTGLAGLSNEVLGNVLQEMETLAAQLMAPQGGMQ